VPEQEVVVDFAGAGLVAPRIVSELDMRNTRQMRLDGAREIALHDLHMIDVVLNEDVVGADLVNDRGGIGSAVEIEAGNVARIDRLDQQLDAGRLQRTCSVRQIGDQRRLQQFAIGALRRDADEAIQLAAAERAGIVDGAPNAVAEFRHALRKDRNAALAPRPVAGRQIVQDLTQPVGLEPQQNVFRSKVIRKQIFDAGEPGLGCGLEAVEEIHLVEHHGQIGGEFRHGVCS